jgi:hypothetical protein
VLTTYTTTVDTTGRRKQSIEPSSGYSIVSLAPVAIFLLVRSSKQRIAVYAEKAAHVGHAIIIGADLENSMPFRRGAQEVLMWRKRGLLPLALAEGYQNDRGPRPRFAEFACAAGVVP